MPLGLDHGKNGHDDDEKKNNSHAGTLPVGAGVTYTNGAKTESTGLIPVLDFGLSSHDMALWSGMCVILPKAHVHA
jgi:hypothetical protein